MHNEDHLIVDPACEAVLYQNDGNEVKDDCALPLDLELTERVEVDDETSVCRRRLGLSRANLN